MSPFSTLFFRTRFATWIATCCGVGFLRPASGTWGSAAALAACAVLEMLGAGKVGVALLALATFALGVPAAQAYGKSTGRADHSHIVIDEFAAQAAVLVFAPTFVLPTAFPTSFSDLSTESLLGWGVAFVLFRFYDIVKPYPAGLIDRRWKNGWGVMTDDVAAAAWTVLSLWLLQQLFGVDGVRFFL